MKERPSKTVCHTPTPGKKPTAIPTWKYELLREAILSVVPVQEPGIPAKDLASTVQSKIDAGSLKDLGSVSWHVTTVRLNMEVEGELGRIAGSKPLRIVRCQ